MAATQVSKAPKKASRRTTSTESSSTTAPAQHAIAFPSELGWMAAVGRGNVLLRLTFGHRTPQAAIAALGLPPDEPILDTRRPPAYVAALQAFARGEALDLSRIEVELPAATAFQRRVMQLCRAIPRGQTRSYAELAALAGSPGAARAVGNIMASNRLPLVIPCHRVVGSGGALGGYSAPGGLETKLRLLEAESGAGTSIKRPR
jgi:methylated-DNA-[protein]-cysteine S-methyltransferase